MQNIEKPQLKSAIRFSRVLRLPWVMALGASISVGLGVYTLLGEVVRFSSHGQEWQPYLLLALIASPLILTYAERAAAIPGNGGVYDFARTSGRLWLTFVNGWVLLGGYIALIALLGWEVAQNFGVLFEGLFQISLEPIALLPASIIFVGIWNLTKVSGSWRNRAIFIILSIIFLVLFSAWAILSPSKQTYSYPIVRHSQAPLITASWLICSLWGINFIVGLRSSVKKPETTILSALFATVMLGCGLGILASFAYVQQGFPISATIIPFEETALRLSVASVVVFLYALFGFGITLIGLNYSITSFLRIFKDMRQDGFIPTQFLFLNRRTEQFLILVFIAGVSYLLLYLAPISTVMGVASLGFLWSIALIHVSDFLYASPKLPDDRKLKLPFHPLFPGLVVSIGVLLPFYLSQNTLWIGLYWIVLGTLFYIFYANRGAIAVRRVETVIGLPGSYHPKGEDEYRVMVVLNSVWNRALIYAGIMLARARNGNLLVLQVIQSGGQSPEQISRLKSQAEWKSLKTLVGKIESDDVKIIPLLRLSPDMVDGIVETVNEDDVDLLLMGWDGEIPSDDMRADDVLDTVIKIAPCDVAVLRGRLSPSAKKVTVPIAGGPHSLVALDLGKDIVEMNEGELSLIYIVTESPSHEEEERIKKLLEDLAVSEGDPQDINYHIVKGESIEAGILSDGSASDLIILGVSRAGVPERPYFGGFSAEVAYAAHTPTILFREKESHAYHWLQIALGTLYDLFPTLTLARRLDVIKEIKHLAVPSFDYTVLMILSSVIATMGLLQSSAAVIIGAMLIAPLMNPILAISLSMVIGDVPSLLTAVESTIKGMVLVIVVSAAMVLLSPITESTFEIITRTQPNLLDLIIALAAGAAAGYASARKELGATLPGIAIAAAVVPPLCVTGYGISTSQLELASGALLLFITNLIAIIFSSSILFLLLDFYPRSADRKELLKGLRLSTTLLLIIFGILGYSTMVAVKHSNRSKKVETLFREKVLTESTRIESFLLERDDDIYVITSTIINFGPSSFTKDDISELEEEISETVGGPVIIRITIIEGNYSEMNLKDLDLQHILTEIFKNEIVSHSGSVIDVKTDFTQGYSLNGAVIMLEDRLLSSEDLQEIQRKLGEAAGAPVSLGVTVMEGRYEDLSIDLRTPTPVPR